jgi:hypothetical protein
LVLAFLSPINCRQSQQQKKAIIQTMQKKKDFGTMWIPNFFSLKKIRQKEKLEIKKLEKEVTLEGFDCQFK